jgi:nucleoside 2-deoxyribosyltransferase
MARDYRGAELHSYREIVELDKLAIRKCHAVLARPIKPSFGTAMEIHYAWTLGIPVVLWLDGTHSVSPWLRYHSTSIVATIEDAVSIIRKIP